jgi:hypothetical protein
MKRKLLLLTLLAMSVFAAGQEFSPPEAKDRPPARERLFFGGSFGLQFGTITNIEVSPVVGFWVLPRIAVAAGPSFQWYKNPYESTIIYGGRTFTDLYLIQDLNNIIPVGLNMGIYAHVEYEGLSIEKAILSGIQGDEGRLFYDALLVGPGISQMTGRRSSMNISVLWCLTNELYDFYSNPVIRFEFYF